MGWDKSHSAGTHIWNAAVDNALLESIGTFTTGWRLPNFQEFVRICYSGSDRFLNYAPFYFASNNCFHTGATYFGFNDSGHDSLQSTTSRYPCIVKSSS